MNFDGIPNVKPFRAFRAVRALRSVRYLTSLRYYNTILEALINGLDAVGVILVYSAFQMTVFGIMGVQLFSGRMKHVCITRGDTNITGLELIPSRHCDGDVYNGVSGFKHSAFTGSGQSSGFMCPRGAECINIGTSPNDGWTNFDDIFSSIFTVGQIMTTVRWSETLHTLQDSYDDFIPWIYLVFVVYTVGFFTITLYTAAIVSSFKDLRLTREATEIANARREYLEANRIRLTIDEAIDAYDSNEEDNYVYNPVTEHRMDLQSLRPGGPDKVQESDLLSVHHEETPATIHSGQNSETDYQSMSVSELRGELEKRGANTKGIKPNLIKRLRELDQEVHNNELQTPRGVAFVVPIDIGDEEELLMSCMPEDDDVKDLESQSCIVQSNGDGEVLFRDDIQVTESISYDDFEEL